MRMTNEEIYKMYKHGGRFISFREYNLTAKQVYNALKKNGIQAVLVKDNNERNNVYIYDEVDDKFKWLYNSENKL